MRSGRSSTRSRVTSGPDIAIVLAALLGIAAVATPSPLSGEGVRPAVSNSGPEEPPILEVSPPRSTVMAGATLPLRANWTVVSVGCVGSPLWFRWEVAEGPSEGVVNPQNRSMTNFSSSGGLSGSATAEVSSGLLLTCSWGNRVVLANASAMLTVVAPLVLENLSLSPNPIGANGSTNLTAVIGNGEPPYQVQVAWGDGNVTVVDVPHPGSVSIPHRFRTGSFAPEMQVRDAFGDRVDQTVNEPVSSSPGPVLAIVGPAADLGVPVPLRAILLHPPSQFSALAFCNGRPVQPRWSALPDEDEGTFTCLLMQPGVASIFVQVTPAPCLGDPLTAELREPVALPFRIAVAPFPGAVENARPSVLPVRLSGGTPPFELSASSGEAPLLPATTVYSDGQALVPFVPNGTGHVAVQVLSADGTGYSNATATAGLTVVPALDATRSINETTTAFGIDVAVAVEVSGGAPPMAWWIVPASETNGAVATNGTLEGNGTLSWDASYDAEGATSVDLTVVDALGVGWNAEIDLPLIPPLEVSAAARGAGNSSGSLIVVNATIAGGLPPFAVNITANGSVGWIFSAAGDGEYSWSLPTNRSGTLALTFSVEDALGVRATVNRIVELPGPANSSNRSSSSSGGGEGPPSGGPRSAAPDLLVELRELGIGVATLTGLVVAALFLRRRRTRPDRPAPPRIDPVEVIRGIVEPAEGAERSTVELLAEEAGISEEEARSTIDRLIAEGTLRAETGDDGEEVLAWSVLS
jgi:hypothetical protein